jgi:hypothetical protein
LGVSLTTLLTALISLRATTTCLPTRRTGWGNNASTIMRRWRNVSKRGWIHRRQTSLTQAHKTYSRYDRCFSSGGDSIEKLLKYVHISYV